MKTVKVKKGWPFKKIAGKPSLRTASRPAKKYVAAMPVHIPFIKPRLLVSEGDRVKIGTALFEDKQNTGIRFLSPGGGILEKIDYGPRRVIKEMRIRLDDAEAAESFDSFTASDIDAMSRDILTGHLMNGGMWGFLRQLPFRNIADPEAKPHAVWVTLGSADPFQPSASVYLKDNKHFFDLGIKALDRLAGTVHIAWHDSGSKPKKNSPDVQPDAQIDIRTDIRPTHRVRGGFPASDAGVVLFHTKQSPDENRDWFIDGQDVVLIGKFLHTGVYPTERTVAFSDGMAENSCHITTRAGVRFSDLAAPETDIAHPLWVAGGLFTGYTGSGDNFLGYYETSVMIIEKSHASEFFGFVRPGWSKLSNSRTLLSALSSRPLAVDSDMHGEERPCVNCGYCAAICPVDIMPQYTYKSLYADEIEDALRHGLLDCVECGLCSFVCPSKIDLTDFFISARKRYHKELQQGV